MDLLTPRWWRVLLLVSVAAALLCTPAAARPQRRAKKTGNIADTQVTKPAQTEGAGLSGGVYRNPYFGLEFRLPSGWGELGAHEDGAATPEDLDLKAKATLQNVPGFYSLLRSAPVSENSPQINLMAQALPPGSELASGEDFVRQLASELQRSGWRTIRDVELLDISGRNFWRTELIEPRSGMMEGMVFTVVRGHALGFLLAAGDRNQLSALYRYVKALKMPSADGASVDAR